MNYWENERVTRRRLPILTFALAAFWIITDQVTKWLAVSYLTPGVATPLIGEWFQLRLVYNPGAAFGLGTGYTWILTAIAHIVDFLDYGGYFVGNIADIALVGAAIGAVLLSFYGIPFSEPEHREPVTSPASPSDAQR